MSKRLIALATLLVVGLGAASGLAGFASLSEAGPQPEDRLTTFIAPMSVQTEAAKTGLEHHGFDRAAGGPADRARPPEHTRIPQEQKKGRPVTGELDANWQTPFQVSSSANSKYAGYNNGRGIATDTGGNVHVVWYDYTGTYTPQIHYRKWVAAQDSWYPEEVLSVDTAYGSKYYPAVACDHMGNVHVVWYCSYSGYYGLYYRRWSVAAASWDTIQHIVDPGGNYGQYYPAIACQPGGSSVHIAWCGRTASYTINLARHIESTNSGATWGTPRQLPTDTLDFCYDPSIAVDVNNNVYIVWRQDPASGEGWERVWYRQRYNTVWGSVIQASNVCDSDYVYETGVACDTNGSYVHIVWSQDPNTSSSYDRIYHRQKSPTGNFGNTDTVFNAGAGSGGYNNYDVSMWVTEDGTQHFAWEGQYPPITTYYNIWYRTRSASGTLGSVEMVTGYTAGYRYRPNLTACKNGIMHIVWYGYPTSSPYQIYYSRGLPLQAHDVGVTGIGFRPPVFVGDSVLVRVAIENFGSNAEAGFPVSYDPGTGAVTETYYDTVPAGSTVVYNFTGPWVPTDTGHGTMTAYTALSGDGDTSNDTAAVPYVVCPLYHDLPFYENLDGAWGPYANNPPECGWHIGWTGDLDMNDWFHGAASNWSGHSTSHAGLYWYPTENPSYDTFATPVINCLGYDSIALACSTLWIPYGTGYIGQIRGSTNGGASWPYTLRTYSTSYVNGYETFNLSWATNQSSVKIAWIGVGNIYDIDYWGFDDVLITGVLMPNAAVTAIDAPDTIPATDSFDVEIEVYNSGDVALPTGWYVYLDVLDSLGAVRQHDSMVVEDSIFPDDYDWFLFEDRVIPDPCFHTLLGYAVYPDDGIPGDDTLPRPIWSAWHDLEIYELSLHPGPPYTPGSVLDSVDVKVHNAGYHHVVRNVTVFKYLLDPNGDTVWTGSFTVDSLFPCETLYDVEALPETLDQPGAWKFVVDAPYAGDHQPGNNHAESLLVTGLPDIGAVAIVAPTGRVDTGAVVTPTARFRNNGDVDIGFMATFYMWDPTDALVYAESLIIVLLARGADTAVSFPAFNVGAVEGDWVTLARSFTPADQEPDNDTVSGRFSVSKIDWPSGWVEVSQMPLPPSGKAVKRGAWNAFSPYYGKFYITKGYKTTDFYSYDPLADTWDLLTGMPYQQHPIWYKKVPRKGSKGCARRSTQEGEDHYVYVTQGNNSLGFWRYSPGGDSWTIGPDVPLGPNRKKVKGGTDLEYVPVPGPGNVVGYVYLLKGYKTEFYRLPIVSLTDDDGFGMGDWEPLPPVGGVGTFAGLTRDKIDKGSWLEWDEGKYLYVHTAKYHDLVRFDLDSLVWEGGPGGGMPFVGMLGRRKKSKDGGSAAYYDNAFYALKGGNTQEFWKYDLGDSGGTWLELDTMPAWGSTNRKKRVKYGADIEHFDAGYFFSLKGNKTVELWRYGLPQQAFASRPARSGVMGAAAKSPYGLTIAPNPLAQGAATVRFSLPKAGPLTLTVFDVAGRSVGRQTLLATRSGAATLDLRHLSAGVYLVKLEAEGYSASRKLIVE